MNADKSDPLEKVIREAGEGWVIDSFSPKHEAMGHLRKVLKGADACAGKVAKNVIGGPQRITEDTLLSEYKSAPHKVQAFLQALGETQNPDMLVMAWQILDGMEVNEVSLKYLQQQSFDLTVRLVSPNDGHQEQYSSSNINDSTLLRHFGVMTMGDKPVFDGFYALRYER